MIGKVFKFIGFSIAMILILILSSILYLIEINNINWLSRISFEFTYFDSDDQFKGYESLWKGIKDLYKSKVFK